MFRVGDRVQLKKGRTPTYGNTSSREELTHVGIVEEVKPGMLDNKLCIEFTLSFPGTSITHFTASPDDLELAVSSYSSIFIVMPIPLPNGHCALSVPMTRGTFKGARQLAEQQASQTGSTYGVLKVVGAALGLGVGVFENE